MIGTFLRIEPIVTHIRIWSVCFFVRSAFYHYKPWTEKT